MSTQQIKEKSIIQIEKLKNHIDNSGNSGLKFYRINYLRIQYSKGKKTRAGSYIEMPQILKVKNGFVNIRNTSDEMCIVWCLLANKYYNTISHNKKSETSTYEKYLDEII